MKKLYLFRLITIALLFFSTLLKAQTLTTPSYVITITNNCQEGAVVCDDIRYVGVNRKNKKSISLKGHDLMHYSPEDQGDGPGKTPCRHIGYTFKNGKTNYLLTDERGLEVQQGPKQLLKEQGVWTYE